MRYTYRTRAIGATVSAGALHAQGWGFESLIAHHRHRRPPPPLAGRLFVISRLLFREPGPPSLRAPQRAPRRPRHRARLVAMVASLPHRRAAASASPPRRPAVTSASPPRRPAVTPASLPPCRHVSSARFLQSSVFLQNRGIFVQITEQRRKMRTPLLGNCVASR